MAQRSLWRRTWYDEHGRLAIWQFPNVPLILWAVFTVASLFFNGRVADVFSWAGSAALIVWAYLEITKGSNYFRRGLGALVLIWAVLSLIKNL